MIKLIDPRKAYTAITEPETAATLQGAGSQWRTVQVRPPNEGPPRLERFIAGIHQTGTRYLGMQNTSPVIVYEIRRPSPETLRIQYSAPNHQLERRVRSHLTEDIPSVSFDGGEDGLPISAGDTVGGALITPTREDWHPLRTDHDKPPINAMAATLHRHAMQNTKFVVQLMLKPIAGRSFKEWYWKKRAVHYQNYRRKEKESFWGSISPDKRDRLQADAVKRKMGEAAFKAVIRILVINGREYTAARVNEVVSGFNAFNNPTSQQTLDGATLRTVFPPRLTRFAQAVSNRDFHAWSQPFRVTQKEAAALLSLPTRQQENIPNP